MKCAGWVAIVILLWASPAGAEPAASEFIRKGLDSYAAALDTEDRALRLEGFRRSERLFARATQDQPGNPALYTNLGNAALQAEHLGAAVLAYRRALALDPSHPRAVQNLEFSRTLLAEWVPRPESGGLLDSFFFWHRTLSRGDRVLGAALAFALAGFAVAAGIRFRQASLRNVAILPALAWVALAGSLAVERGSSEGPGAVLVAEETVARAADSALAPAALSAALPAGVEVEIVERRTPWLRIRLANGRDAWVAESAVEAVAR
jgi:tetratricopeptide (TPR) repeat protein